MTFIWHVRLLWLRVKDPSFCLALTCCADTDCEIPFLAEHELPEKQRMMEVHGSAEDEMPAEARVAGQQAAENAANPSVNQPSPQTGPTASIPAPVPAPSTPSVPAATTVAASSRSSPQAYPETHITMLTNLGVSRQEAINALDMSSGDPDLAASLLF
ncbi:hypothetical protein F4703DRAFT_1550288 [Phycomyces blakesleeanus]